MNVGLYHVKHNRTMYSVMFGAFVQGLQKHSVNFEIYNIKTKHFKPSRSHDLAVAFTNAPRTKVILEKQKQDKNRYLTLYTGAFSRNGAVNFRNRNKIYGWDTNTKPRDDALLYCDLLSEDYMTHEYYKGRPDLRLRQLDSFGVEIKPYKKEGCILIPEQIHPEGMGHGIKEWLPWAMQTCNLIRENTDRKIRIRRHPNRTSWKDYAKKIEDFFPNVEFTYGEDKPLGVDLEDAHSLVTLSSRCVIEAIINGTYIFTKDVNSLAWACSNDISNISSPSKIDRRQWLSDIAYSHWGVDKIANGDYWDYLRKFAW